MENQDCKSSGKKRSELLASSREAPDQSGVYLMKDFEGEVLYVGKAKSLKSRVSSYFQLAPHERRWTEILVGRIERFEVILTETEAEALILEATLIKRHKPKFNIRLKDDKSYPYLKVQLSLEFPRIEWTRRALRDDARYFGPFPSAWSARQVMELLNQTFLLRDCSDNSFRHRSRPCLLYQMQQCTAPCVKKVTSEEYGVQIRQAVAVLEGKSEHLLGQLRATMDKAADDLDFEMAAQVRDQIQNIEVVTQTQAVADATSQKDRDVFGLARILEGHLKDEDRGEARGEVHGTVMQIRAGKLMGVKHFVFQNADQSMTDAQVLRDFIMQYYSLAVPDGNSTQREIIVPFLPDDQAILEKALGLTIEAPHDEETEKTECQLIRVAQANATYALEQNRKKNVGHGFEALEQVQDKLQLSQLPKRIECFDISNIQGDDAVASRVVFMDGAPDKNLYRRYKIRTVEGANDFAMMKEVLGRRFSKALEVLPDLVVVDGGKGQLAQAEAIMKELGIQGVAIAGLAKARTESDFQAKEVKSSQERIFLPGRKNPVVLHPTTAGFKLLTHIRDEAHRFAITYHRKVRSKARLGK